MARRRTKKRTHVGASSGPPDRGSTNPLSHSPKSMVIRIGAGEVGPSVSQLVKDVRAMMQPGTASRLKERRSNRLRDYTAMAGPLGVSHLLLFSRSSSGNINFRLALTPRGPTLHFRVEQYSLSKDVRKSQRHPVDSGKYQATPPLLIMNNFTSPSAAGEEDTGKSVPRSLESLTTTVFQSLFPPISPASTPLSSVGRVLLLNRQRVAESVATDEYSEGSYILQLRHYSISTKATGVSRGIKRFNAAEKLQKQQGKINRGLPDLGKLNDVSDYLLDPSAIASGFTSGSESEVDSDVGVEILETAPRKVLSKTQINSRRARGENLPVGNTPSVEKRAVKLVELGPRMTLRMMKIEEGVCGGKVMWHEFLSKTGEEVKAMDEIWEQRRLQREERKNLQKANVERKRRNKVGSSTNREDSELANGAKEDAEMEEGDNEWDSEDFEDDIEMELGVEEKSTATI